MGHVVSSNVNISDIRLYLLGRASENTRSAAKVSLICFPAFFSGSYVRVRVESGGVPEKKMPCRGDGTQFCYGWAEANKGGDKNNSLLSDDEIDMVVTLRMNRDFMNHMWLRYYPEVIKSTHPTYDTIVSVEDLLDQKTTNNEDDGDLYQILVVRLSYMCDPIHTYIRMRIHTYTYTYSCTSSTVAVFSAQLTAKVGSTLPKAASLRINLNIDGTPITSRTHTHPSHS